MKQTKAVTGANEAAPTSDQKPDRGDPYKLGYTVQAFPAQGPAESNADVATTKDNFDFEDEQDGTSVSAYKHQPETINAETGK